MENNRLDTLIGELKLKEHAPGFHTYYANEPVSISRTEGAYMANYIIEHRLAYGYEIATAFGFSSWWLGLALKELGAGKLITIDSYVEETSNANDYNKSQTFINPQPRGLLVAKEGAAKLGIEPYVEYVVGKSPEGVGPSLERGGIRQLDFAFIDGNHFGDQPSKDVQAIKSYLRPGAVVWFHDVHCTSVQQAIRLLRGEVRDPRIPGGWGMTEVIYGG